MITPITAQIALVAYGILLIVGGLVGYLKAGSRPSLIAGSTSGVIAAVAGGLAGSWPGGIVLGLILAVAMLVVFGMRLARTRKFMPSGLLLIASLVIAIITGLALGT